MKVLIKEHQYARKRVNELVEAKEKFQKGNEPLYLYTFFRFINFKDLFIYMLSSNMNKKQVNSIT